MNLLLDENLSRYLVQPLSAIYERVEHVVSSGLMTADDESIWSYAQAKGLIVVSKDADFAERSFLYGHPPKVVWIRTGNCRNMETQKLLSEAFRDVQAFALDPVESCLVLGFPKTK